MRRPGVVLGVLLVAASAGAQRPGVRIEWINARLSAVVALGERARDLTTDIRPLARRLCTDDATDCGAEIARTLCSDDSDGDCAKVVDVALTNFWAEEAWVDRRRRIQLLSGGVPIKRAVADELERVFLRLAARLALATPAGLAPAPAIDRFCLRASRAAEMPWNRCVAALVWSLARRPRAAHRQERQP